MLRRLGITTIVALFLVGCNAKIQWPWQPDPGSNITAQAAYDMCRNPNEVYDISPYAFPIAAKIMRHTNCLGVPDMLIVVWYGDRSEPNEIAARLLSLMYVQNFNDANPKEVMSIQRLKIDELKVDEEVTHIMFSRLHVAKKGTQL